MLFASTSNTWACGGEVTYNYYLFHTWAEPTNHYLYEGGVKDYHSRSRIDDFWREYTGNPDCTYLRNKDEIEAKAKQREDAELLTYMKWLDTYIEAGETLNRDEWNYPTKEELAACRQKLQQMLVTAQQYNGTRLRPQYMLLQMRANMLQENHAANRMLWEKTASKLPKSVYRDLMENIYAGALFHLGEREKSCEIFARQGDGESIQWALLKFRNLAGIQRIYEDNPNSYSLYYLVDEYVNNVQEFTDQGGFTDWDPERMESVHNVAKEQKFRQEALDFADFAKAVVAMGKTNDPCMWQTARAMVHYELGFPGEAHEDIQDALRYKGTESSKQVARCVAMLIETAYSIPDKASLVKELQWLTEQNRQKKSNYLWRAEQRILIHGLAQRYHKEGNHLMETAVWGFLQKEDDKYMSGNEEGEMTWNPTYSTPYMYQIDLMKADDVIAYYGLLKQPNNDVLDRYILRQVEVDENFFNDYIGTRLLRDARFAEAIPYLQQVPLKFMEGMNVSYYLAHRDYHVERWYKQQRTKQDQEGPHQGTLTSNPKLDFCREAIQLQDNIRLAGDADSRAVLSYKLGTMLYQACPTGECWYLAYYGNSAGGYDDVKESTIFWKALKALEDSRQAINFQQRMHSLYALAYLPADDWCTIETEWHNGTPTYIYTPLPTSFKYSALDALDRFTKDNPSRMDRFVTKCDVLKQFRKNK